MKKFEPVWHADKPLFKNEGLPSSLRLLILGDSNCGKSFLLLRLLLEGNLDYNNLVLFTPSLHQIEYQILIQGFKNGLNKEQIMALIENQKEIEDPLELIKEIGLVAVGSPGGKQSKSKIDCQAFDNNVSLPLPGSFDKKKKNLVVFDDCAFDDQSNIHSYFTRGRHNNVNSIYLSQNYFQLPRRSIRGNSNCFVFFKLNSVDLTNMYKDLASTDFPNINDFKQLCEEAWKVKHGYLFIDKTETDINKKYKRNYFD